jgi:hypothetical protein
MTSPASRRILRISAVVLSAASTACVTSPVYWPNSVNTPQIMQRGDAEGSVFYGTEGHTQIQASVAVTRKLVVSANGNYVNRACAACAPRQHQFAEIGMGTYSTDINDKTVSYMAGIGAGTTNWVSASQNNGIGLLTLYRAQGDYTRGFVQVGAVERRENYFVATSMRFTGVFFSNYKQFTLDTAISQNAYTKPRAYKGRIWSLYIEPSVRFLWRVGKVHVGPQLGLAFPMNAPPAFGHRPATFNLGVDIGGR